MKRCKVCGERKPLDEFYRAAGMADGHRSDCKVCNLAAKKARYDADPKTAIARVKRWQDANPEHMRAYRKRYRAGRREKDRDAHLRRKFDLTLEDFERMLAAQGGGCAICGRAPTKGSLHVDHDHDTGEVRGLLCVSCNNALGAFEESCDRLRDAASYLELAEPGERELAERARARARELVGA